MIRYKIHKQDHPTQHDKSGLICIECLEKYFLGKWHEGRHEDGRGNVGVDVWYG